MNISKRAEEKLMKQVPENHVVRYRHYRLPLGPSYQWPNRGPIWAGDLVFGSTRDIKAAPFEYPGGIYERGGRTIATIYDTSHAHMGDVNDNKMLAVARGEALCSFSDSFCKRTGRTIALGRALKMLNE